MMISDQIDSNPVASKLIHRMYTVCHFVASFITDISTFLIPTLRLFAVSFLRGSKRNDPGN